MRSSNRLSAKGLTGQPVDPRSLRGIPGHIYVLRNSALKQDILHIGMSRRGGWAKALELNRDKSNLIPGSYECVFEVRAQDSGAALEALWAILKHTRQGNGALDFFEIDEASAMHLVQRCVDEADVRFRQSFCQDIASRPYREIDLYPASREVAADQSVRQDDQALALNGSDEPIREGIFKKALSWLT